MEGRAQSAIGPRAHTYWRGPGYQRVQATLRAQTRLDHSYVNATLATLATVGYAVTLMSAIQAYIIVMLMLHAPIQMGHSHASALADSMAMVSHVPGARVIPPTVSVTSDFPGMVLLLVTRSMSVTSR